MTPVLSAVYDELIARATTPPHAEPFDRWVQGFLARTGVFPADHPESVRRLEAAREDALCRGGWAARLLPRLSDPGEQTLASLIPRAHRGVFSFETVAGVHVVQELLSGAAFVLVRRDSVGREVVDDNLGSLCVGRIVGASDGCAMLPGVVFHRADATACIESVVKVARDRGVPADQVCDALLRMDFALLTMSRIRPAFAYRPELLEERDAAQSTVWRRHHEPPRTGQ